MYKHLEGFMNNIPTWINCVVSLLVAIVIAGCGGGESAKTHAPGEIEQLSNATIYHLQDGVFIHEAIEGAEVTAEKAAASWYSLFPTPNYRICGWSRRSGNFKRVRRSIYPRPSAKIVEEFKRAN